MALTDDLDQATAKLKAFAEQLRAVSAEPVRIEVASSDLAEAEAFKCNQRTETITALHKALGR